MPEKTTRKATAPKPATLDDVLDVLREIRDELSYISSNVSMIDANLSSDRHERKMAPRPKR